jgi:redox-sensitive bicupin YhaK (pirin superfamily)
MSGLLRTFKTIQKIFPVPALAPKAGSNVHISIGSKDAPLLDPFVFCVYFDIKVPYGFPDHPHIGMETVTYITDGQYDYEDFHGHKGSMKTGHLQWMTAGKGLVHAERPDSSASPSVGFQIWMNLPLQEKFCNPVYQELPTERTPVATKDGVQVKVLAGETLGVKAPTDLRNPGLYLDINMPPNTRFEQPIPRGWNTFNYVHGGLAYYGEKKEVANANDAVVLNKDEGDILAIETRQQGARIFMASAATCNEPIYHDNSIILGSQEAVDQAKDQFAHTTGPFADAKGWESDIKKFLDNLNQQAQQAQGK